MYLGFWKVYKNRRENLLRAIKIGIIDGRDNI